MRIIGGKQKRKEIFFLKSTATRPLKDSVKENIFNVITHSNLIDVNLKNSKVLDLYSGIGSFGLECLSRGAKTITFVEKDQNTANTLEKNLLNIKMNNNASIFIGDISNFLKQTLRDKFEIIFLDPPFINNSYIEKVKVIKQKKIYKKNHLVIIHREKNTLDNFQNILEPIIVKQYGRSKIIFGKFL